MKDFEYYCVRECGNTEKLWAFSIVKKYFDNMENPIIKNLSFCCKGFKEKKNYLLK